MAKTRCLFCPLAEEPGEERQPESGRRLAAGERARKRVLGIVGRDGGYTAKVADVVIVIPTVNPATPPAFGSLPGGGVAPFCQPSETEGCAD